MSETEADVEGGEGGGGGLEVMDKAPPISAALRAKILADPNVAKIAEALGVPLDEYVNQIGYYVNNPDVEPALLQASDEDLKTHFNVDAPTFEQITANVKASNDAFVAGKAPSAWESPKKSAVELPAVGGESLTGRSDPNLEALVKKGRFPSKG